MAIRSTNAGRHMPTGGGMSGGPPASYRDHDPNAPTYGNVPGGRQQWYGDPNERLQHSPGSARGQTGAFAGSTYAQGLQSPRWSDRNPAFDYTPDQLAAEAAARQPYIDRRNAALNADPAFQQATQAGNLKAQLAAMVAAHQANLRQNFMNQGGQGSTWDNRFDPNNNWPVPRSPSGNYQYAPGRPGPTPPNVAGGAPTGGRTMPPASTQALTPEQNPMFQGYMGGGAGVPQGAGGFGPFGGGYNPGQSKSGMGQSPMSGPMSTGGDTGMYDLGGGYPGGGYNPNAMANLFQMLQMSRGGGFPMY